MLDFATLRGQAMALRDEVQGAMVSLRCDAQTAEALLPRVDGYLTVANLNSPRQTVLSGELAAVETMVRVAQQSGISARLLPVSGAFHSRLCADAAQMVAEIPFLQRDFQPTRCRIFSSTDGEPSSFKLPLNTHFSRQILSRVDFIRVSHSMAAECDLMIELGPGRVLSNLVRDNFADAGPPCLPVEGTAGGMGDFNRVLAMMFSHGVSLDWEVLFENRLIRPFVPAVQKSFVTNPCELLESTAGPDDIPDGTAPDIVHSVLSDAFNGLPEALVNRYLETRGAFLNRMVQADLEFWDPAAGVPTGSGVKQIGLAAADAGTAVQDSLFRMVATLTGFAPETLSRDARLLDDLNLDSIKAGDLIARFARENGIVFPDPALLANASLGELSDAAQRLHGDALPAQAHPAVAPDALGQRLLQMVADVTGFPMESLGLSMRLLDDLNLDSIKAADLVARFAGEMRLTGRVDAQSLANASLEQVVKAITTALETRVVAPSAAPDAWVNFCGRRRRSPGSPVNP